MENIIKKLYDLHLTTSNFPLGKPDKESMDEEWGIYNALYEELPKQLKERFLRYVELCRTRQNEENKSAYEYGFKTAIQCIVEGLKE